MSSTARWVLGSFALLFAAAFAMKVSDCPSLFSFGFARAFVCSSPSHAFQRSRGGPAIRVIGAIIFAIYAVYLGQEITKVWGKPFNPREHEQWISALEGFVTFGLPGIYVALSGRYPTWSKLAPAFLGRKPREFPRPKRPVITR